MSVPDEAIIREYQRQSEMDPLASNTALYSRTAERLGVEFHRVEITLLDHFFGWGAG